MAKRVDFLRLPVKAWQQGDTVAAYRNGKVVRIPIFGEGDVPAFPDLAAVATTGKYSDLLNKPVLGTAASKDSTAFAAAAQGTKADTAYSWGDHSQAGYAQASAVASALSSKVDRVSGASLYPDADAVKLGGIASGATKNATDAQLRDRGSHTGTQSVSTITGLASVATSGKYADLTDKPTIPSSSDVSKGVTAHGWGNHAEAGYVKTNTTYATGTLAQLNAGTDTTGRLQTAKNLNDWLANKGYATTDTTYTASTGLDLSGTAFSVKYGTAAGTAAQGNDSRLSNGREWTAGTVSQAEAEVGTASTRRAWTAQRVRQAIQAWFLATSGTVGRNILGRSTAAEVRNDLGLGTAATRNVGTGSGNLMEVGAFGIGDKAAVSGGFDVDVVERGIRYINAGVPASGNIVIGGEAGSAGGAIYVSRNGEVFSKGRSSSIWGDWRKMWDDSNFNPDTKANTTTQVIAGNGLSGGGNLSANRTLTLGTPSTLTSTSTNSVSATSHTHELGADVKASLTKADSALIKAQNLNDLPNKATARTNLGLGNASVANFGTSSSAVARGNHVHNQYWDIVNPTGYAPTGNLDDFSAGQGGYVRSGTTNPNAPQTGLDVVTKAQYGGSDLLQIAYPQRGVERLLMRTKSSSGWGDWLEFYHTNNKPSKADVGLSNIPNSTTASRTDTSTAKLLQAKAMNDHRGSGDHDGRYYTKAQTDALVAGATTGANVWQNATTALIKNAYNKVAFPSPKTLTLPSNPTENDYVAIITASGNMQGSKIARNSKTIMGLAEDMEINMLVTYLRLDYVNGSWRIAS